MGTNRKQFYASLIERVIWTFLQAAGAAFLLDGVANTGLDNGDKLKLAAIAGGISVLKNVIGSGIGNGGTPAWLPAELDPATFPGQPVEGNIVLDGDQGSSDGRLLAIVFVGAILALIVFALLTRNL